MLEATNPPGIGRWFQSTPSIFGNIPSRYGLPAEESCSKTIVTILTRYGTIQASLVICQHDFTGSFVRCSKKQYYVILCVHRDAAYAEYIVHTHIKCSKKPIR